LFAKWCILNIFTYHPYFFYEVDSYESTSRLYKALTSLRRLSILITLALSYSGTGLSPFEVTFGCKPPNIPQYITGTSNLEAVDELLTNRDLVFASLRKKLLKAQNRMKKVADGHMRDKEFQIGDWVIVKLRPHQQVSATRQSYSKLSKRFYGPFQVEDRIGKVAYKL